MTGGTTTEKKKKNIRSDLYDWVDVTKELTAEEKGRLIDAIVMYAQGKADSVHLTGNEKYLFPAFRKQIDRENEKSGNRSKAATIREHEKAQKAQETAKSTKDHKNANNNKNNNDNEETVSRDTGKN